MLIATSSCSINGYKPISKSEKSKIVAPHIFNGAFEKVLYKTSIVIYGNSITGLTLIKKTDSAYRVVSMSELGMKYFDLEFPLDEQIPTIVHYVMEPLNKKLLVNLIINDFDLTFSPPMINKLEILINTNDSLKIAVKHNKFVYFYNPLGKISEIAKHQISKPVISLSDYADNFPKHISFNHGKIWFEFKKVD